MYRRVFRKALWTLLLSVGIGAISLHADEATDYTFAYRLYEAGDYETAKEEFLRFLDLYPASERADDALFLAAESARFLRRFEEAAQYYRQLESDFPQSPLRLEALHGLGSAWFEQGKYEEAILALEKVVEQSDDDAMRAGALFYIGEAYYNIGNYPLALKAYDRLVKEFPDAAEARQALYGKGWAYFQLGQYKDAHATMLAFLEKYPDAHEAPEATYRAAESLFLLEDWEGAQALYRRFVETYGDDEANAPLVADAELRIGQCLFRLDRKDEARQQFQRLVQLYPNLPAAEDAQYWVGEVLFQAGKYTEAIYEFERLLNAYPASSLVDDAEYSIGRAHFALKEYRQAIEAFEAVVDDEESPLRDAARWYLAECRRLLEEYHTALIWYRRVSPTSDYADDALFGEGASYFALGDFDAAIEAYQKLLGLKNTPLKKDALYQLGVTFFNAGRYDEAATTFDRFLAEKGRASPISSNDGALYWQLQARYRLKDYAGTIAAAQALLNRYPKSQYAPTARFFLAESLYWQRKFPEARGQYEQLLQDAPDSKWAGQARYNIGWTHFSRAQELTEPEQQGVEYRKAIQVWNGLVSDPEFGAPSLYYIGIAQLNLKQHEKAIASFQAILDRFPNSEWIDDARYRIAWTYYLTEAYDRAEKAFGDFLRQHPNSPLVPEAIFFKGNANFKLKRYREAIAEYTRVVEKYPTAVMATRGGGEGTVQIREEAQYQIGESYYNLGQYEEAIAAYETLQKLYPKSLLADDAQFAIAAAYQLLGDDERALAAYRKLVKTYPDSDLASETLLTIGFQYFDRKEYQQAIAEFQDVIRRYRDSDSAPRAQYNIGLSYYNLRSYPQAVDAFEKVLTFPQAGEQEKASALYFAALTLRDENNPRRDLERAITLAQRLIADYPETAEAPRAYLLLAEIYREQNRLDEQVQAYRDLIAAYPDSEETEAAYVDLGSVLLRLNRFREALEAVSPITDAPSQYRPERVVGAQLIAGDAYMGLQRFEDAAKAYLVVALVYESQSAFSSLQALCKAGDAYEKAGKPQQAMRWYSDALKRYQKHADRTAAWSQYLNFAKNRLEALRQAGETENE